MFSVGDTVLYGNEGIFVVEEITQEKISGKICDYYTLKSKVKDSSVIYLPTENQALLDKIHPLLSENEINELLSNIPDGDAEDLWIDDNKLRKEKYREILENGRHEDIIRLASTLYRRQKLQKQNHRKLGVSDERALREAERIIGTEFSFVLGIELSEVPEYIRSHIDAQTHEQN